MWHVLSQEGLFEGRSDEEKQIIFDQVKTILRKDNFEKEDLAKFIVQ